MRRNYRDLCYYMLNLINDLIASLNSSLVKIASCGLASLWSGSAPSPSNTVWLRKKNRPNTRQTGFLQATLLCGNLNQYVPFVSV